MLYAFKNILTTFKCPLIMFYLRGNKKKLTTLVKKKKNSNYSICSKNDINE